LIEWIQLGTSPDSISFSLSSIFILQHLAFEKTERVKTACLVLRKSLLCKTLKQPFINAEEKIVRVAGHRTKTPDGLSLSGSTSEDSIAWRESLGGVRVPRGVYRFKTHEEADQWLWRMITRPKN
jgi:hypothetical protein